MNSEPRLSELADLQRELQGDAALTLALESAFDTIGFTEAYIARFRHSNKRKSIKDSVWGMLDFSAFEMNLIDSPLLQRMRGIRQLGFTYLTYPSAEHNRFIHSLGMAHVVSNFIASIDRDRSEDSTVLAPSVTQFQRFEALKPLSKRELLYAALLHDIGHMPFSHASEAPIASRPDLFELGGISVEERMTRVHIAVGKDIPLSEVMSIIIVLSERFEKFYEKIDPVLSADVHSILRIASLICGIPTVDSCPNIQDIISAAAVDADKIDYVNRDARACGISVGVDVSRIFLGGGLVQAKRSAYDADYDGDEMRNLFVVNSSGADTLDEILQARSSLYQRVYLHPLTRTAEALLARALRRNAELETDSEPALRDALSIWSMNDTELLHLVSSSKEIDISSLGGDLKLRHLPKKACAFAGSLVLMQSPLRQQFNGLSTEVENAIRKDVGNSFLEQLTIDRIGEIGTTYLEDRIFDEANRLADRLKATRQAKKLVPADPLQLVVITPIATIGSSRPDAQVFQNGEIFRTPALTNVQGQQDASDLFKAVGYVLCDNEWRHLVFQASRTVIYQESIARNPGSVKRRLRDDRPVEFEMQTLLDFEGTARRSNLKLAEARDLEHAASKAGYFDAAPLLAKRTSCDDDEVRKVATKFDTFDGEHDWRVRAQTVAAFADQCPPSLRKPLLMTLAQGTHLNQSETQRLVLEGLNVAALSGLGTAILAPLSSSSGGATLAMIKQALPPNMRIAASPQDALAESKRRGEPILLIDDNAVSGVQSAAQLYSFSPRPKPEWPKELQYEKHLFGALSAEEWHTLCSTTFAIVVAVGADGAKERLQRTSAALGIGKFQGLFYGQKVGAGLPWAADVAGFLQGVGRDLMAQHEFGMNYKDVDIDARKYCDSHCFGYGNHGGVTVTHVNVPSSTVTALWQPGRYNGRPWIPLFLRRGRFSELVLA
jgi:HD superfamily phosphohydrolase